MWGRRSQGSRGLQWPVLAATRSGCFVGCAVTCAAGFAAVPGVSSVANPVLWAVPPVSDHVGVRPVRLRSFRSGLLRLVSFARVEEVRGCAPVEIGSPSGGSARHGGGLPVAWQVRPANPLTVDVRRETVWSIVAYGEGNCVMCNKRKARPRALHSEPGEFTPSLVDRSPEPSTSQPVRTSGRRSHSAAPQRGDRQ